MSRVRALYSDDCSILIGCSICGNSFRYPFEIRKCEDGLYRCNVYCTEKTTPIGEARKVAASQRKRGIHETASPLRGAKKPSWF